MIVHSNEQQIPVEKYGARRVVPRDEMSEVTVAQARRATTRAVDRGQALAGVIEIPGTRHGVWEYRERCYSIDPAAMLAYVGGATGAEAVHLSNQLLDSMAAAMAKTSTRHADAD